MNNEKETALEQRATKGARLFSPSAARNRDPIRNVLLEEFPGAAKILEVGGGSGEHAVHFAGAAPYLQWRTGDPDETARSSIAAWIKETSLPNLEGPHSIDVMADNWTAAVDEPFDGIVSINMVHIAPFEAAIGLFKGAGAILRSGGKLFLYGPFSRHGEHVSPSNEAFDASLKSRDPRWGVRDLEGELIPLALKNALQLRSIFEMPANNFCVIFEKEK